MALKCECEGRVYIWSIHGFIQKMTGSAFPVRGSPIAASASLSCKTDMQQYYYEKIVFF